MPSWKKVITSGSSAAFSSLIVSNTITGSISGSLTGSLQGTASWAEYVVNGGNINTSSLVTTSSFNAFTSSVNTFTASYNTGSFSGSFSGSFYGTASWAQSASQAISSSYALTASYALNGGVTSINIAGTGLSINQTTGAVIITGTGGGGGGNTATGSYGSFYDTGSQTAVSATTIYSMSISTTDISNGVFISGSTNPYNTYVKFTNAGVYNIQFSAQFRNTGNNPVDVTIWTRKNNISSANDIADSSGKCTVPAKKGSIPGHLITSWNYYISLVESDFIQLLWHADTSNEVTLETIAAGVNPTHPRIPSLILTANRIDTFLSNTGSFTGSFTGELIGTASWAQSASQALTASFVRNAQTASFLPIGTYQITSSWAINALTASFAPNYLLTSSFNTWTGSVSSQFDGTSSYTNFPRLGIRSGSITGIGDLVYHVPFYRNVVTGFTGSVYTAPFISSTGILAYSSSLDRLLTTASWAVNALTTSYAKNSPSTSPQGNISEIQYNVDGTNFGGVSTLTYDGTDLIGTGRFDGNLRLGLFRGTQTDIVVASDTDEVLIYTFPIPSGTFTDDDVIRVRWRTYNASKGSPEYYIYIADTDDFNTVSGSAANIIAFCTASNNTISYLQMKRDFPLNSVNGRLEYITPSTPLITDDVSLINGTPIRTFAMDWNETNYWMFFSAKPNDDSALCVSKYCTIERI